jgi:hypothetical protein
MREFLLYLVNKILAIPEQAGGKLVSPKAQLMCHVSINLMLSPLSSNCLLHIDVGEIAAGFIPPLAFPHSLNSVSESICTCDVEETESKNLKICRISKRKRYQVDMSKSTVDGRIGPVRGREVERSGLYHELAGGVPNGVQRPEDEEVPAVERSRVRMTLTIEAPHVSIQPKYPDLLL